MSACVKCGKELPENAAHCVFCGAKQTRAGEPQRPAGAAGSSASPYGEAGETVTGLLTDELIAELSAGQAGAGGAPGAAGPGGGVAAKSPEAIASARTIAPSSQLTREALGMPAPAAAPPPAAPPPAAPPPAAPPPAAPSGHPGSPFERQGVGHAPSPVQPHPGQPMAAGGAPGARPVGGFHSPPGAPPPVAPAPSAHAVAPVGSSDAGHKTLLASRQQGFGAPPAMPEPAAGASGAPATVMLDNLGAGPPPDAHPATPPFLASQTLERMGAPQEPWADILGTLMLILGIALVACFVMPWSIGEDAVQFSWTHIADAPGAQKLNPLAIGITGLASVVFGLLSMGSLGTLARGVAAAALGALALIVEYLLVRAWAWSNLLELLAALTLISGLLLRSQYQRSMLARALATVGVVMTFAALLVPRGGEIVLFSHFEALAGGSAGAVIQGLFTVLWDLLPLFALLCWLPAPGRAGAHVFAWLFITQPVLLGLVTALFSDHAGSFTGALTAGLRAYFLGPVALMAWLALLGYGMATVLGKQLEHR